MSLSLQDMWLNEKLRERTMWLQYVTSLKSALSGSIFTIFPCFRQPVTYKISPQRIIFLASEFSQKFVSLSLYLDLERLFEFFWISSFRCEILSFKKVINKPSFVLLFTYVCWKNVEKEWEMYHLKLQLEIARMYNILRNSLRHVKEFSRAEKSFNSPYSR